MNGIQCVDVSRESFDVHRDLSITTRERQPGPPIRIDGMTIGVVEVIGDAPHRGEVHPDGDEILFVLSGKLRLTVESDPDTHLDLGPGDACIVRKGEWHQLTMLEPARLVHVTPGPHGDHRPL